MEEAEGRGGRKEEEVLLQLHGPVKGKKEKKEKEEGREWARLKVQKRKKEGEKKEKRKQGGKKERRKENGLGWRRR